MYKCYAAAITTKTTDTTNITNATIITHYHTETTLVEYSSSKTCTTLHKGRDQDQGQRQKAYVEAP